MKKVVLFSVVVLAVVMFASAAWACIITFEPEKVSVGADGKGKVTAVVKWEHRKCILEEDDINIDLKGVKMIKQSGWKKIKRGLYKNEIEFELTAKDEGSIRVWRECAKKGVSEGIVKITRKK